MLWIPHLPSMDPASCPGPLLFFACQLYFTKQKMHLNLCRPALDCTKSTVVSSIHSTSAIVVMVIIVVVVIVIVIVVVNSVANLCRHNCCRHCSHHYRRHCYRCHRHQFCCKFMLLSLSLPSLSSLLLPSSLSLPSILLQIYAPFLHINCTQSASLFEESYGFVYSLLDTQINA
jgi:hypothetical protein